MASDNALASAASTRQRPAETSARTTSSSGTIEHLHFPTRAPQYRAARNALLAEEIALRRQIERVAASAPRAAARRQGAARLCIRDRRVAGPCVRRRSGSRRLFAPGKDTSGGLQLHVRAGARACRARVARISSTALDGAARHIDQRVNFWRWSRSRRCPAHSRLRSTSAAGAGCVLLSTAGNDYDRDYFGDFAALPQAVRRQQEFKDGEEWDMPISKRLPARRRHDPPLLGLGAAQRAAPSRARSIATTTCSTRCGTRSTSRPRGAATSRRSSATDCPRTGRGLGRRRRRGR